MPPSSSTRTTWMRSPAGSQRRGERRDELRAAGLERARQFTWDETARLTLDVYREAAA